MKPGAWHQLGWNHHKMVIEQLQHGAGVGVIVSPRDLRFGLAQENILHYKAEGASVILDPQWHIPGFTNAQFADYPTADLRNSITSLTAISDADLIRLRDQIVKETKELGTDAVVAPAVLYAAARNDIFDLNARLHEAAKQAASILGKPCYGTAFLGESITSNQNLINSALSTITSLNCDGWYYGFQFAAERIPSDTNAVYRCLQGVLLLAQTGKPVLHGYAGPMGLLSFAGGCTAAASGPSKKQFRFCPERWEESDDSSGGGGNAPPRYFSSNLWGTLVFPDESGRISSAVRKHIFTPSPFAPDPLVLPWTKGDAAKHLAYKVCEGVQSVSSAGTARDCLAAARKVLDNAISLHRQIATVERVPLKDSTASYQVPWRDAINLLEAKHSDDFDYLEMIT